MLDIEDIFIRVHTLPYNAYSDKNIKDEYFLLGVFLSSRDLFDQYQNDNKNEKIIYSLYKYWTRATTRCTPYGVFAGVSLIPLKGGESKVLLEKKENNNIYVKLDNVFFQKMISKFLKEDRVLNTIKFYINNTLYKIGNKYRFIEYSNNYNQYNLISLKRDNLLCKILNNSKQGLTITDLKNIIMKYSLCEEKEADIYVKKLIDCSLFIPEIAPIIVGNNMIKELIKIFNKYSILNIEKNILLKIEEIIENQNISTYRDIENIEKKVKNITGIHDCSNILHVDTIINYDNEETAIDKRTVKIIQRQIRELKYLFSSRYIFDLEVFKKEFKQRYGDEQVPLTQVLDVDYGIGYGEKDYSNLVSPILDDVFFQKRKETNIRLNHIHKYILNKYIDYLKNKEEVIEITEKDINEIKKHSKNIDIELPKSIFGSLYKNKKGFEFEVKTVAGGSSVYTISRFGNCNDKIKTYVRNIYNRENSNNNFITAEIVHSLNDRSGNISHRLSLSDYEIPYLNLSKKKIDNQIHISDILVFIKNDRVFIRSKKHSKIIMPKLTSAHNFGYNSLPIYKFLCDIQYQDKLNFLDWDWGILSEQDYLPRVIYKDIIVKKAIWKIKTEDIKNLDRMHLRSVLKEKNIPMNFYIVEKDEEFFIDINTDIGERLFYSFLKKQSEIILTECIINNNNAIVKDKIGNYYSNEIVIPFLENVGDCNIASTYNINTRESKKKEFVPIIDEWLYFKIYISYKYTDDLILNVIRNYIKKGIRKNSFEKFFFIRYKDEQSHLRIRFFNKDVEKNKKILDSFNLLLKKYIKNGIVNKVVLDTYKRENNRYESKIIENVESLFFADSIAVIDMLYDMIDKKYTEEQRMLYTLKGIDKLLNDFNYSLKEKVNIMKYLYVRFFKEFGEDTILQKQLNIKYRKYRNNIALFIEKENISLDKILKKRSLMIRKNFENITQNNFFIDRKNDFISSYLHMFINRIIPVNQRKVELVMYYFLYKYYASKVILIGKNINE